MRRIAVALVIATAGLVIGALCAPTLRKHYYVHRLQDADLQVRLEAMNILAGIAVRDPGAADPLVQAFLSEANGDETGASEAVETIAVWAIERVDSVHEKIGELLPDADDDHFLLLAGWLDKGGHWRRSERSVGELVRRERLRLAAAEPTGRLAALDALEQLGPEAGPFLNGVMAGLLHDPAEAVRREVVTAAAVCLAQDRAVRSVLLPALADSSPAIRREAVINLGLLRPSVLADEIDHALLERDERVETALLWALRRTPAGRDRAISDLAGAAPDIRRTAAWALGFAPDVGSRVGAVLVPLLEDDDQIVAARAAAALGRRGVRLDDIDPLIALAGAERLDARLAALYALGCCARGAAGSAPAIAYLRRILGQAIQAGEGPVAAAAVESLGRLGDEPFLSVMLDIVDQLHDQPMVQYAAACAAPQLDQAAGFEALLKLCSSTTDELRELAAFRISLLPEPDADLLIGALRQGGDPLRGGAALALGLCALCRISTDQPLAEWLAERLDPKSPAFEASWRIRAEYLCAGLVCGDRGARGELDVYLLNRNVSRVGLFVALLHHGDAEPLDLVLSERSTIEAESFLADARFVEVVVRYFPGAPFFLWQEDGGIRRLQTDRLRRWWRLSRHLVRFDPQTGTYGVEEPAR